MPTYVYGCSAGHEHEVIQRITEPALTACVKLVGEPGKVKPCGAPCSRILQPANFSLKGGGWFKDGYSSSPPAKKDKKSAGGGKKDT